MVKFWFSAIDIRKTYKLLSAVFSLVLISNFLTILNAQGSTYENSVDTVVGSLPSVVKRGLYLVTGDIFVPPGSTVTIEAGTVFMFKEFTGLHVQGVLYAQGEPARSIVFTSASDSAFSGNHSKYAAPYDWNGIDVYEGAPGTTFSYSAVRYSVYGIRSQTEFLKIDHVSFTKNGKSALSIKNDRKEITDSIFSLGTTPVKIDPPMQRVIPDSSQLTTATTSNPASSVESYSSSVTPMFQSKANNEKQAIVNLDQNDMKSVVTQKAKPQLVLEPPPVRKKSGARTIFRVVGTALFVGGGVAGVYFGEEFLKDRKRLNDLSDLDAREKQLYTSADWQKAKNDRDFAYLMTAASAGAGVLGLTSFVISFAF
jgi:hypothetical protein